MGPATVNYLAVLLAAVGSFGFGAVWYMMLSKPWLAASEFSIEQRKQVEGGGGRNPAPFIVSFVSLLIMASIFAALLGHLSPGGATLRGALLSAFFLWLGFVITSLATNYAFGMRKPMLTLIDGGHWLGVLIVQGLILGLMGR